ncbi:hypothetical protein RND71_014730 [Anisodus tanguticus]|uniref:Uncharacterized protein n=1 Tax=Anisodus tanguticus TaxID=243964 RepID=A0AAE1VNX6_9SOLA|nr:hypothetical protein RND71_014730 [Anisodus tanguticus]
MEGGIEPTRFFDIKSIIRTFIGGTAYYTCPVAPVDQLHFRYISTLQRVPGTYQELNTGNKYSDEAAPSFLKREHRGRGQIYRTAARVTIQRRRGSIDLWGKDSSVVVCMLSLDNPSGFDPYIHPIPSDISFVAEVSSSVITLASCTICNNQLPKSLSAISQQLRQIRKSFQMNWICKIRKR